jgi:hypothetical protein
MRPDFYTKAILTVIAFCLFTIAIEQVGLVPSAYAGGDHHDSGEFNHTEYAIVPVNADGSIDVNIKSSSTMDVSIKSCDSHALEDAGPIMTIIYENQDQY